MRVAGTVVVGTPFHSVPLSSRLVRWVSMPSMRRSVLVLTTGPGGSPLIRP